MTTVGFHLDHRLAPGSSREAATRLGEILSRPCFRALTRVAVHSKNRDQKHQPKSAEAIARALLAEGSDAAVIDSGREGKLAASARIWTGRHIASYDEPKPFLASYVIVPYEREHREALLASFAELAGTLQAVAGYVAVTRDHDQAHRAVLSQPPRKEELRDFPRRARERKAHYWYDKKVDGQVAGPDWALILGPGHLKALPAAANAFQVVREAGPSKLVQLSEDPEDALAEAFEARLEEARRALAPVLMDISSVPVD